MIFLAMRLRSRRLAFCFRRLIAEGVLGMAASRDSVVGWVGLGVRSATRPALTGEGPILARLGPLVQVPQALGDVEVGVVVGGDLVVVLLGDVEMTLRLGDPAEL